MQSVLQARCYESVTALVEYFVSVFDLFIDPPGKLFFVAKTIDSITIGWNSQSLHNIAYTVQINDGSSWVDATCGSDSVLPSSCRVHGSVALISGLKQNTVYRFRVSAIFKDIRSDFSQPSDPLRTAGDARKNDYCIVTLPYIKGTFPANSGFKISTFHTIP